MISVKILILKREPGEQELEIYNKEIKFSHIKVYLPPVNWFYSKIPKPKVPTAKMQKIDTTKPIK